MLDIELASIEEGFEKLKKAVSTRDQMGGAMYFNICEEDCLKIADKLSSMGASKLAIASSGGWELRH